MNEGEETIIKKLFFAIVINLMLHCHRAVPIAEAFAANQIVERCQSLPRIRRVCGNIADRSIADADITDITQSRISMIFVL